MKNILLLIFLTPIICFSQTSFSCDLKEQCSWNERNEDWKTCDDAYEDNSLFIMNKNETMFTHTTSEIKSTYYVKEKTNKDRSEEGFFTYEVVSDTGNEYYFIFDLKNKEVKAISMKGDNDDDWYLIRYYVKAVF